jgi:CRP-like cAMP-binding protein
VPSRNSVLTAFGAAIEEIKPHLTPTSLRAGQLLAEPERRIERVFFLTGGLVSARIAFETAHEVEIVLAGRNTAIGAVAAMGIDAAVTRAVCLFDAHAWSMPVAALRAAVRRSPAIEEVVEGCCRAQMSFSVLVGACNSTHPADKRLARWLVLADDLTDGAPLWLRQEESAAILGVQRSVVNPALQKFQADRLISTGRGRIEVLDAERLRERACGCHRLLQKATWPFPP